MQLNVVSTLRAENNVSFTVKPFGGCDKNSFFQEEALELKQTNALKTRVQLLESWFFA